MINELRKQHPYFYYVKNSPSLGHDKNILSTLQLPDTDYIWLAGDSVVIRDGSISRILEVLTDAYDFIFLNSYRKNIGSTADVGNVADFLLQHAWYLTLTGATVYNANVITALNAREEVKYYKNFQQLGIILDYVSSAKATAYWL